MAISQNFPTVRPTLSLNFARSKTLDPRITFERNSIGTYVDEDGLIKTASADEARFDHDPATGESLGLLIEESRTNKLLHSEDFTAAGWGNVNVVKTADAAVAPDGTTTADEIYATSSSVNQGLTNRAFSGLTQNVWHTFSVFWKPGTSSGVFLQLPWNDGGNAGVLVNFTLSNGELTTPGTGGYGNQERAGYHIKKYPNGWWRVGITFRATGIPGGGNGQVWIYPSIESNGTRGTNLTSYLWGAQMEVGYFTTSYLPTTNSNVNRAADYAKITGTNFTDFYNQTEGSFVSDIRLNSSFPVSGYASISFTLSDNSFNNRVTLASSTGSTAFNADVTVSGTTTRATLGNYTSGASSIRTSIGYKESDTASSLNGATVATSSPGTLPLLTRADIGKDHVNNNLLNGHIRQITYYSKRLTNAQLQNLTK